MSLNHSSHSRRRFLKNSVASLSAAALASRTTWLQAVEPPQSKSPNEKLGFAIIGVGGRGGEHIRMLQGRTDAEILYLCDVDEFAGRLHADNIEKKQGRRPTVVQDFRKALEDKNVDCVSSATPNHWHSLVSIWSMQAGKDVYIEKPVSHNVWEGRQAVNAARTLGRICQCGTQSRSSPSLKEAVAFVQSGKLGKIKHAIATCYKPRHSIGKLKEPLKIPAELDYDLWCGPAAKVDLYRPRLHYDWHWDFNTGNGDLGNQGIHQMDIARWFLGETTLSPTITSIGGRVGYDDAGNTANSQIIWHGYENAPLIFEVRGLPRSKADQGDKWNDSMDEYRGSRVGVIVQCEQGHVLVPSYGSATAFDSSGNVIQKWSGEGNHHENFIKAVRSRKHTDLNADILEGHLSSALCHTGNIAYRLGRKAPAAEIADSVKSNPLFADSFDRLSKHLTANEVNITDPTLSLGVTLQMDPVKELFPTNAEANALRTREYRPGFVVPEIQA